MDYIGRTKVFSGLFKLCFGRELAIAEEVLYDCLNGIRFRNEVGQALAPADHLLDRVSCDIKTVSVELFHILSDDNLVAEGVPKHIVHECLIASGKVWVEPAGREVAVIVSGGCALILAPENTLLHRILSSEDSWVVVGVWKVTRDSRRFYTNACRASLTEASHHRLDVIVVEIYIFLTDSVDNTFILVGLTNSALERLALLLLEVEEVVHIAYELLLFVERRVSISELRHRLFHIAVHIERLCVLHPLACLGHVLADWAVSE